jgi:hypothetical protein
LCNEIEERLLMNQMLLKRQEFFSQRRQARKEIGSWGCEVILEDVLCDLCGFAREAFTFSLDVFGFLLALLSGICLNLCSKN